MSRSDRKISPRHNDGFVDDETQPPSYASIFLYPKSNTESIESTDNNTCKIYSIIPTTTTNNSLQSHVNTETLNTNTISPSDNQQYSSSNQRRPSLHRQNSFAHLNSADLFQHSFVETPVSYDELFTTQIIDDSLQRERQNSRRFSFLDSCDDPAVRAMNSPDYNSVVSGITVPNLRAHNSHQSRRFVPSSTVQQLNLHFPRKFTVRHSMFICGASFLLIIFQTILMSNSAVLSHLGSGIWAGLGNLLTLLFSIITRNK
jgi:hypothetical protein